VAAQQKLGIRSQRRPRPRRGDFADPGINRQNLSVSGENAGSLAGAGHWNSQQKAPVQNERTGIPRSERESAAPMQKHAGEMRGVAGLLEIHRHRLFLYIAVLPFGA
jgi:hypothetical protein